MVLFSVYQEFKSWLDSAAPEQDVLQLWDEEKPLSMSLY